MLARADEFVLAIDVGLDRLDATLLDPQGQALIAHQAYDNNRPGYLELRRDLLALLPAADSACLTLALESTAAYWWHVSWQLTQDPQLSHLQPELALLDPKQVKRFRSVLREQEKTDPKDAHLIAACYRAVGAPYFYPFSSRYLGLRHLTRAYHRLVQQLAAQKTAAGARIYLLQSEYARTPIFDDLCGPTSAAVLTDEEDLEHWAGLDLNPLAQRLQALAKGHLKDPQDKATRLQQVIGDSYPCPDFLLLPTQQVLQLMLEQIRHLEQQKKSLRRLIEEHLELLPESQLARQQKGLGPILVAGCLSEIQDTRRFCCGLKRDSKTGQLRPRTYRDGQAAVAKLAGLCRPRSQSGRAPVQKLGLPRDRNPHLRYWFCQAAYTLKAHQSDYHDYYWKKRHEASHHSHQRALVLTARKAARPIFALLYKGQQAHLPQETAPRDRSPEPRASLA